MSTARSALDHYRFAAVAIVDNGQQPAEIVELAVVTVDRGQVSCQPLVWLVRPSRPVTRYVTRGWYELSDLDTRAAPAFPEVAEEVAAVLDDRIVVAHRANHVRAMLHTALPDWTPQRTVDTRRLAQLVWPTVACRSLSELTQRAALTVHGTAGRARYDAQATALLFLAMAGRLDLPPERFLAMGTVSTTVVRPALDAGDR